MASSQLLYMGEGTRECGDPQDPFLKLIQWNHQLEQEFSLSTVQGVNTLQKNVKDIQVEEWNVKDNFYHL